METDKFLEKIKAAGFEDLDRFVKAHLHYLSDMNRRMIDRLEKIQNIFYRDIYSS